MENPSFDFLPYSTDNLSMRRDEKPDPVPPPNEWNTRNPCRPEQLSAILVKIKSNHLILIAFKG